MCFFPPNNNNDVWGETEEWDFCFLFTLTDGAVGKVVHLHGDGEILQVVEELEEGPELLKADALRTHGGY